MVDKISSTLEEEDMEEDDKQDEEYSDYDDEEMPVEDNPDIEPADSMTLVKYQAEAR